MCCHGSITSTRLFINEIKATGKKSIKAQKTFRIIDNKLCGLNVHKYNKYKCGNNSVKWNKYERYDVNFPKGFHLDYLLSDVPFYNIASDKCITIPITIKLSDIVLVSWKSKNSEYREIVAKRFTISKATWNKTMRLIKNVNI
jgi:uncharacterized protein YfbU (UPF0304 family)